MELTDLHLTLNAAASLESESGCGMIFEVGDNLVVTLAELLRNLKSVSFSTFDLAGNP
jgi:hypothetical protein